LLFKKIEADTNHPST